ncbi:hypothetical protein B0H11DRAFT_1832644 [Mycena galericulata]|nr:hypothetical protein B0H11DRAFT_1832644 [Mycena galericulata]
MDSLFQSMLYTNTVPSDAESKRIQDILASSRKEAASVAEEIVRMQNLLEPLLRKRDALNEFIDAHMSLVSPARRLPPDIVRAIFIASLPFTRNCVMSGRDSPLLLCQICSAWRKLALSTPQLWSSLHIVVPRQSRIDDLVEMVTVWLSRSGVIPLSLSVCAPDFLNFDPWPVLGSLATFSMRWKHISITLPTCEDFEAFTSLSILDVPMLRTALLGVTSNTYPNSPWSVLKFLSTPSLRDLSIIGEARFLEHNFASTQLVHLKMIGRQSKDSWPTGQLSYAAALEFLRQCPALETCVLELSGLRGDDRDHGPVVLANLWSLKLRNSSFDGQATDFIEQLTLPNLRSLHYSAPLTPEQTISFSRVAHGLTHLSLYVPEVDATTIVDCLRPMQGLRELEITGDPRNVVAHHPDTTFFAVHFSPDSEQPLCPNLRRLYLHNIAATSDEALLALIQSRASSNPRLERFSATLDRWMQFDIIPQLQPIIDATGLKVSLTYSPDPPSPFEGYSPWQGLNSGDGAWHDDCNLWES